MASSFLSALGVTPAAPPASAYSDQAAETANIAAAKSQLTSVTSSVGLALSAAKLAGVDTTNLDNLNTEAKSLSTQNLTSAQLKAKTDALSAKLSTAQATQEAEAKVQAAKEMEEAISTIQKRVTVIQKDKTTSAGLLKQYTDLLASAQAALAAIKAGPPKDLSGAAPPTFPTPDALLSSLDELDGAKETEENKVFSWSRLGRKVVKILMYYTTFVAVAAGALLGGIVLSNTYASDPFWGIRVFYFVYGAAFFPLSLLYGAAKPPYWVATLIPLQLDEPVQTGGGFSLPALPPLPSLPNPTQIAAAAQKSVAGAVKKAIPKMEVLAPIKKPAAPAAPAVPAVPAPELPGPTDPPPPSRGMFAFKLVDPNTPTPTDTSNKSLLRGLTIANLAVLAVSATYYGVDKLISSNMIKV